MTRTYLQRPLAVLAAALMLGSIAACSGSATPSSGVSTTTSATPSSGASTTTPAQSAGVASAAAGPVTCAPGTDGSLTPVAFQLNFTAGGYNAGFALALQENYYKDAGLNVSIAKGQGSGTTAKLVASGQAGLAYADAVAVMQLIAKGAKIKILSTMYQTPTNAVTVLKKSGITKFTDLKGKSIAEPVGEAPTALMPILLDFNKMTDADVKRIPMPGTAMTSALLQGQVDAILGSTDGYSLILEEQGAELVNFPFADYGVATVGVSIIASESFLAEHGDTVKCFIQASLKGWDAAIKNPKLAIDDLVKTFPNDTRPVLNTGQLKAAIALFCTNGAKFVGKAEPEAWTRTVDIAQKVLKLPTGLPATAYYTYDYLPQTLPTACPIQ